MTYAHSPPVILDERAVSAAVVCGGEVQALEVQRQHEKKGEQRQPAEDLAKLIVHVLRVQSAQQTNVHKCATHAFCIPL